jgi:hypothetical protein
MKRPAVKVDGKVFTDGHWHFEALMRAAQTLAPADTRNLITWADGMAASGAVDYGYLVNGQYESRGKL